MLEFNESTHKTRTLALHYAHRVGDSDLVRFMSSEMDVNSPDQAEKIIEGFWALTDLAVEDHHANISVDDVEDIEFWMYKLFNKVHGYMVKNGFGENWQRVSSRRS